MQKRLTNKEIDQFCKTVIYFLIDAYDPDALCESGLSLEDECRVIARMKYYASKYITDHVNNGNTTNTILKSVRKKPSNS